MQSASMIRSVQSLQLKRLSIYENLERIPLPFFICTRAELMVRIVEDNRACATNRRRRNQPCSSPTRSVGPAFQNQIEG